MRQMIIDMPDRTWATAPFMISHHDEASSWCDSPVLRGLIGQTIILLDHDGMEFCGEVREIKEDGLFMTCALVNSGWDSVFVSWFNIKHIYYC